jgi:hypothetical protein
LVLVQEICEGIVSWLCIDVRLNKVGQPVTVDHQCQRDNPANGGENILQSLETPET